MFDRDAADSIDQSRHSLLADLEECAEERQRAGEDIPEDITPWRRYSVPPTSPRFDLLPHELLPELLRYLYVQWLNRTAPTRALEVLRFPGHVNTTAKYNHMVVAFVTSLVTSWEILRTASVANSQELQVSIRDLNQLLVKEASITS